ncbi:MAG: hypothetical protein ACTSRI_03100 [Promethearchaeota archaeon]
MSEKEYFLKQLNKAKEFMSQERYREAIILLERLKSIEKKGNFGYSLTHELYNLISNSHSLYNQQIILKYLNKLSKAQQDSINFQELFQYLTENEKIGMVDKSILRREVELLILRKQISCKINKNDEIEF